MRVEVFISGELKVLFYKWLIRWTLIKEIVHSTALREAFRVLSANYNGRRVYLNAGIVKLEGILNIEVA